MRYNWQSEPLTRGNHGNQTMGQPRHLSHCLHDGKTYSCHLLPSGEGGWNKSSKYSKPCANMPSMIAGASGGASLMTAANNRQQAILPKLTQLTKINNKIKLQSKCNILNYFQRVFHVTSFLSPFLFSCFVILLCPLPSRGFNNSRVAGRCTRL